MVHEDVGSKEAAFSTTDISSSRKTNSSPSVAERPSLHSIGTGLFQTHITWDDIEKKLQNEKKTNIKFGPNKNVRQVGDGIMIDEILAFYLPGKKIYFKTKAMSCCDRHGIYKKLENEGFMSRIAVIDPDYQVETKDLPHTFAVKMVTILPSLGLAESVQERHELQIEDEKIIEGFDESARNLHNREVDVYRIFSRFNNSLSKMPLLYFTQNFTKDNDVKGFIGMEFVENVVARNIFHNVRPEELSEAVRALAYLEAKSLELSDEEKQKVASNPVPLIYPDMIHATAVSKMFQDMYAAAPELEPAGKLLETMTADIVDLELTSTLNKELGMQDVFVHGDLWSANLMWTNAGDDLRLSRIVDYQLAHFGCAAEDLTRLFISTMSGKDRRKNWERLLEEFHESMQKHCFGDLPFSLDQLKESYRRMFPIAGVLLLPVFDMVANLSLSKLSEDEKAHKQIVLSEKKLALFEDILFFARRNQDVRPNKNNSTSYHSERLFILSLGISISVLYCLLRFLIK